MQYIVLCNTQTIDRSDNRCEHMRTHQMMRCVNRQDALNLVTILSRDDRTVEDGPFLISRTYEVGVSSEYTISRVRAAE